MFNTSRQVNFSIAIALTVGWGIFFLLFLATSNTLFEAQQQGLDQSITLPRGVNLTVNVDKKIYRSAETVLIAIRNDSRDPIWIKVPPPDCRADFWLIERLDVDGESWNVVPTAKTPCAGTVGLTRFARHTLKSGTWSAVVPGSQLGEVMDGAPSGTYRVTLPFLKGRTITATTWPTQNIFSVSSASFTILEPSLTTS